MPVEHHISRNKMPILSLPLSRCNICCFMHVSIALSYVQLSLLIHCLFANGSGLLSPATDWWSLLRVYASVL